MRNLSLHFTLIVLFIVTGCGGGKDFGTTDSIVGGKEIANYTAKEVTNYAKERGYISGLKELYGFKAYKIPYTTTDGKGNVVHASGVMVVPTVDNASEKLKDKYNKLQSSGFAFVLDCHGTIFANKEAPSELIANSKNPEGTATLFSSLGGFITLQPDYIGFGDSKEHYHPYLLEKPSANSVKDFLQASIEFAQNNDIKLKPKEDTYLTGYSEGGYVALAALESLEDDFYNIKIAAPMDGPYILEPFGDAVMKMDSIDTPSFVANLLYSYAKYYGKSLDKIIQKKYADRLDELLSGKYTREQIDAILPSKLKGSDGLIQDSFANGYSNSWLRWKLLKNSAIDVDFAAPRSKIRLIHCRGDNVIPYKIATESKKYLKAIGTDVELITVEDEIDSRPLKHLECASHAYKIALDIFIEDRDNSK